MTRNTPRKLFGRRPAWLAAATMTIAMLVAPTAAYAGGNGDGGQFDDSGPGGSNHSEHDFDPSEGHGGEFVCGENIGMIPGALYQIINGHPVQQYESGYPNCNAGGAWGDFKPGWKTDGSWKLCPTGFEVYRFYSIKGKPSQTAVTRSRLNLTQWCETEDSYNFPGQSAWDANPSVAPRTPDWIAQAPNPDQSRNGLDDKVGRRDTGWLTPGPPTLVRGSCKAVSTPNPQKGWYQSASPEARVSFREYLGNAFQARRYMHVGKRTIEVAGTAAEALGFRTVEVYPYSAPNADPAKPPVPDKDGDLYYAKSFRWDNRDCASPFNFTTPTDPETLKPVGSARVTGTCYIPVVRSAKHFGKDTAGDPEGNWSFNSLTKGFGERYSSFYQTNRKAGEKHPGDADVPKAYRNVVKTWRAIMEKDYKARSKAANRGFFGAKGQQILPADHYKSEGDSKKLRERQGRSVAAAAHELANWSKCRLGSSVTYVGGSEDHNDPAPTNATLLLTSHNRNVLQAGGQPFQAEFRVTAGPLTCEAGACGSNVTLTDLSYDMDVVGTNGYEKCTATNRGTCDFKVVSYKPGSESGDGVLTVEFYHPTTSAQRVKYVVNNVAGTYTYWLDPVTWRYCEVNPRGGPPDCKEEVITEGHTESHNFTPSVWGTPQPQRGSGKGPFTTSYPVIGSVDVPRF